MPTVLRVVLHSGLEFSCVTSKSHLGWTGFVANLVSCLFRARAEGLVPLAPQKAFKSILSPREEGVLCRRRRRYFLSLCSVDSVLAGQGSPKSA